MNTKTGLPARTAAIAVFLTIAPLVGAPAFADTDRVTLSDYLAAIDNAPDVEEARLELESARREAAAAGYRGDLTVTLNPSVKNVWPENDRDLYQELEASVDARVPLALSDADAKRLETALDRVKTAEALLAASYLEALSATITAYGDFWRQHEELAVLSAERLAAQKKYEAEQLGLESGRTSLVDALRFRRDLDNAERSYSQARTERDLAYIELLLVSGAYHSEDHRLMFSAPHPESPLLESLELDVPHPDEAMSALDRSHPRIAAAYNSLEAARRDAEPPRNPLLSTVRLSTSFADGHSGSVSASIPSPALSFSYSPPTFIVPTDADIRSDRDRDQSVTLSAVFSLDAGSARSLSADTAQAQVDIRSANLAAAYRSVEASIVSAYRRIESAEANINLTTQAVERAEISYSAVQLRDELGTSAPGEVETATAALDRARFEYSAAQFELIDARVRYLVTVNFGEALGGIL